MKIGVRFVILIMLFCFNLTLYSQNSTLDSLMNLYAKAKHDTVRIYLLNDEIGFFFEGNNTDSAIFYYEKAIKIAEKNIEKLGNNPNKIQIKCLKGKANSLRYIGIVYYQTGVFDKAIQYVLKSLNIYEQFIASNPDKQQVDYCKKGISQCYIMLGNIQYDLLNFNKALEYYFKSLKIYEEQKDTVEMPGCYVNIGNIYLDQKLKDKASEYYLKALKITEKLGDKRGLAKCYNNIANLFLLEGKYEESINFYAKSLKIKEELEDKYGVAMVNGNIAELHILIADSVFSKIVNKRKEHLNLAIVHGLKAIDIAHEIKAIPLENPVSNILMNAYKKLGDFQKSMKYAEIYISTRDSMFKEEKTKSVTDAEKRFEGEKKQLIIDKLNKEKELNRSELLIQKEHSERQKTTILFVIIGLVLVVVFAVFIVKRLQITNKQKLIIENQKGIVDEKNNMLNQQLEEIIAQRDEIESQRDILTTQKAYIEIQSQKITDSINYAKHIQEAVLPSGEYAKKILGEHFILFKPKDIVSGDFYWATRINEWLIIAVVDCTGHGVPGAFMSMLGVSFLNEIVRKKEITKASDVLDSLRVSIIEALHQKGRSGEQKDGMDIAICVINTENNQLQYAGANNPIFIVTSEKELKELEPNKQPVAIYEKMKPFTNHELKLNKGDCIYMATDGYQDQFGGSKNRKFMVKQLKELLVNISDKTMLDQQAILDKTFENWKGEHEQVDDVTILGLKI